MTKQIKKQKAFTLLEVMVALVIFSIGLLGLAGLQSAGIKNNQISYSRTIAQQLVYDMADRIRTNARIDYTGIPIAGVNNDCVNNPCTSAELAEFDLFEWNQAINLPNGPLKNARGFIEPNGTAITISIGWDEDLTGDAVIACNPDPDPVTIACVSMDVVR